MLNLGCGQYLRNPFFPGFWGQKWGCGLCILADYTRVYTVPFLIETLKKNLKLRILEKECLSIHGWKFIISKILNLKIKILKPVVCLQNINNFKLKW